MFKEDIDKLTQLLVHLYSHLTKPILDITLITYTLVAFAKRKNFNYAAPSLIALLVITVTGTLIRRISPKFGKMAADIAKQKGYLRFLYSRIQTNSEEVAFYGGEKIEADLVNKNYKLLKKQLDTVYFKRFWYIIIEQFLLKYVWSSAGLCMISVPLMLSTVGESATQAGDDNAQIVSQRTEEYTTAKSLLTSAADAVERIMTSYKEVIELSGFTRRVYDMFQLFENVNRQASLSDRPQQQSKDFKALVPLSSDKDISTLPTIVYGSSLNSEQLAKLRGLVYESKDQHSIIVESISVITPNGDIIVPCLSLKVYSIFYIQCSTKCVNSKIFL